MATRVFPLAALLIAFLGSASTLIGWTTGFPLLTDWDGDGIAMFANTALAVLCATAAISLLYAPPRRSSKWLSAALSVVAGLIGGLTFSEHLFGWNLGIDTLLVEPLWGHRAASAPGRMGPPASATLTFMGIAILLANARKGGRSRAVASILALLASVPPLITFTAYLYSATALYSEPKYSGIAWQTSFLLMLLSVSLLLAIREYGLGALVRRNDAAGLLVRRLVPISVALLLVTGYLQDLGFDLGLYKRVTGGAALTVVRILMFTALLWWTAQTLVVQIERRKKLEAELGETQERFRVMANTIPQLAWMASPDGWIYWYNQRWHDYTGCTHEQMQGWGWKSVQHPDHVARVTEVWKEALARGESWQDTFPLRSADGEYRWFLSRAMPIRNEAGEVLHWFGTNTDITEQRLAEDLLRETNRMKDEFLATLSHELRTPMSAILGWSQLLRKSSEGSISGDLVQGLEVIERNARLQSQIIDDLLDMNRIISGKIRLDMKTINLVDVARAAIDAIVPSAETRRLKLEPSFESDRMIVRGDPNRLQQVFYNLLTNAVKFTPDGGSIRVFCGRVESSVEFRVTDTGIGIKREFLPHVFERFRQQDASTTRTYGGLGLGLGIVKHLVELHGGRVHVSSDGANMGATFSVVLPVSIAVLPGPVGQAESRIAGGQTDSWMDRPAVPDDNILNDVRGIKVLVVDDEPDARELLRHLLQKYGLDVTIAGSAAEALDLLQRNRPHVLVCDVGMPVMSGYDLLEAIRALAPASGGNTPAIALTAYARPEDRARSMRAGFQLHLSKPVEMTELLVSIVKVCGRGAAIPLTR